MKGVEDAPSLLVLNRSQVWQARKMIDFTSTYCTLPYYSSQLASVGISVVDHKLKDRARGGERERESGKEWKRKWKRKREPVREIEGLTAEYSPRLLVPNQSQLGPSGRSIDGTVLNVP